VPFEEVRFMSATIRQRRWLRPLAVLVLLTWGAVALRGEPLPRQTQECINHAVDRGVRFLNTSQRPNGSWSPNGQHVVGYVALPALTLLECGESPKAPAVVRAVTLVRRAAPKLDATYEIALSILLLDRLGNPADQKLIEMLAARLIAGQTTTGGWSYRCPILSAQGQRELLTVLRQLDEKPHLDPALLVTGTPGSPLTGSVRPDQLNLQVPGKDKPGLTGSARPPSSGSGSLRPSSRPRSPGSAVVGPELKPAPANLPASGRGTKKDKDAPGGGTGKGKPPDKVRIPPWLQRIPVFMEPATVLRLRRDPTRKDRQIRGTTDNSNSQFAALALWAARRRGVPMTRSLNLLVYRYRTSQNEDGSWTYRYRNAGGPPDSGAMTCVGLLGLAIGHGITHDRDRLDPQAAARRARDPQLVQGLAALSRQVGEPFRRLFNLPQPNLYFLWSLERVGVLYNLPTIGGKDWYRWAAECLVANQQPHGNWTGGGYPGATPVIDTCLALLVLKKANWAGDLTNQLKISPGELANSVEKRLTPKSTPAQTSKPKAGGGKEDNKPPATRSQPGVK
jgi:hypothetical protein